VKGVECRTGDERGLIGDPEVPDGIEGVCEDDAL
jgi:hypothetical protein